MTSTQEMHFEYDDITEPTEPELIDPILTLGPTRNWWSSSNELNNFDKDDDLDPYQTNDRSKFNQIPNFSNARSSSSKPSPYFQLLLAGLQVRLLIRRVFNA